jgi:hypothetical protein
MTTDKTWFDERLKENLYLDIVLRSAIWLLIAFLTITYASNELDFSPITPLQKGFNNLLPVAGNVARVALILCFLAVLLKDLEYVAPDSWGQETSIGKIGGVFRKMAGDLSLWIIGAMVTVLASLIYLSAFVYSQNQWSSDFSEFSITIGFILIIAIGTFSVANVWVRKKVSLISSHPRLQMIFNSQWKVICFYMLILFVTAFSK